MVWNCISMGLLRSALCLKCRLLSLACSELLRIWLQIRPDVAPIDRKRACNPSLTLSVCAQQLNLVYLFKILILAFSIPSLTRSCIHVAIITQPPNPHPDVEDLDQKIQIQIQIAWLCLHCWLRIRIQIAKWCLGTLGFRLRWGCNGQSYFKCAIYKYTDQNCLQIWY